MASKIQSSSYHHGDLRQALITHALTIIKTEGISKLTLRKTARNAGVSHAAPAHHFKDMKGLLAAIAGKGFGLMKEKMDKAQQEAEASGPLAQLKQIGVVYIQFALSHPAFFKAMYHPELSERRNYPELDRLSRATFVLLRKRIRDCQAAGIITQPDVEALSLFVWSTVHGFAVLALDEQLNTKGLAMPAKAHIDTLMPLIFIGLGGSSPR